MAKRKTYVIKIMCGNCGAVGQVRFEENEDADHRLDLLDRVAEWTSSGFRVGGNGPMHVRCDVCGSENVVQAQLPNGPGN
jgi:transcription elongation factor Elf1